MAARVLLPTPPCHYYKTTAATTTSGLSHCTVPALPHRFRQVSGRGGVTLAKRGAAAAAVPPEQSSLSLPGTAAAYQTVADVKAALYRALESTDRGIFGMTSAKRSEIHGLVELLESRNPTPEPTTKLKEKVRTECSSNWHLNFAVLITFYSASYNTRLTLWLLATA